MEQLARPISGSLRFLGLRRPEPTPSSYRRVEDALNPDAQLEISSRLDAGESLLWADVPRQGLMLRASDVFMIPFSLLWAGFAMFWFASAWGAGAPLPFVLFGVPFVAMGLHMIAGRFLVDARARARTVYGLTNRRAIIVSGIFSRSIQSLPLRTLTDVSLTEGSGGRGTILFGRPHPYAAFYGGMHWPGMTAHSTPGFEHIVGAKQIYDQLLAAQRAAT